MPLPDGRRSEGDVQRASARRFYIGFGVIIAILMFITYTGVPSNFFHDWFVNTKSWTKYLSIVTYLLAFFWVYRADQLTVGEKSGAVFGIVAGLFLIASIVLSSGFVFDLK
jgi:hypothetical protein